MRAPCRFLIDSANQGYARAARVLKDSHRLDAALKMVDHALQYDKNRRAELDKLKSEILALQSEAARLRRADGCHIGTLPVEVLSEIFAYMLANDADAPLRVGAVCKHWRHATSDLWTRLRLGFYKPDAKAEHWLKMSNRRVDELMTNGWSATAVYNERQAAGDLVSLRKLRLDFDAPTPGTDVMPDLLLDGPPALQELHLTVTNAIVTFADEHLALLSHLQHLRLDVPFVQFMVVPAMSELRSLHVHGRLSIAVDPSFHDALGLLLRSSPLLRSLYLCDGMVDPRPTAIETIPLQFLASIHLSSLASSPVLNALHVPSLERLVLTQVGSAIVALQRFRASDLANLRELRLAGVADSSPQLLPFLLAMPRLAVLQVSRSTADVGQLVDGLALSTLALEEVDFSHCTRLTGGPLVRLVKARIPDGEEQMSRLRVMTIDGCPLVEPDVLPWLRSKVARFSCVYITRKEAKSGRFLG